MENHDYEEAVAEFRKSMQLDPGFTNAEVKLGHALMQLQDYDGAVTAFEHVVKTAPNLIDAHVFLVVAYAKLNRVQDEIRECRTLKTIPEHYGSNLNLGHFLAQAGDLEGAIPSLQKAASLRPTVPVPHIFLANVYAKLGRDADAAREREEAERLGAVLRDQTTPAPDAGPSKQ